MAVQTSGLGLGQLLLALDRTMVTLVEAPRGLDMPVGSVALVDADDVRLGLAVGPGSADLFFLLGVSDADAVRWIGQQTERVPAAIFVKVTSTDAVKRAVALGIAIVAVEPRRGGSCCTNWSTTLSSTTATAATRSTTPAP